MALLNDHEWAQWSDREIARRCAVNNSTVSRIRQELSLSQSNSERQQNESDTYEFPGEHARTYTTKHGTTATMNTQSISHTSRPRARRDTFSTSHLGH